jgi:hypothetical protein
LRSICGCRVQVVRLKFSFLRWNRGHIPGHGFAKPRTVRRRRYGSARVAVARNCPCPCGSGRKYKRCCLAEKKRAAREARFDDAVGRRIQDWSAKVAGEDIGAALEEFIGPDRTMDDSDMQIFATWFASDRELPGGGTPAKCYAARDDLPADEREAAARIANAKLGLHRVLAVEPGRWIELEDIVHGTRTRAQSANVSREAIRWDILLGRVMASEPQSLWGPVRFFKPDDEADLLAELQRLAGAGGDGAEGGMDLASAFADGALELMRFRPPGWGVKPSFFTPEGDPMAHCQATWRVRKPALARDRMRAFGDLAPGDRLEIEITVCRDRLLPDGRPPLPEGALLIETEYVDGGDSIPIATVRLEGSELHVEAMSEGRLEQAIEAVDTDFGDIAEPVQREVTPIEERLEEHRESGPSSPRKLPFIERPAEERRLLSGFMDDHMRRWLDEPLPALGGETPREAAKGERRNDVVKLVRGIENRADRARRHGEPSPEVGWLRVELAIDEELAA